MHIKENITRFSLAMLDHTTQVHNNDKHYVVDNRKSIINNYKCLPH